MSDHEFEKQVRQKLEDLRLAPSTGAWEKIEEGIKDTRRRRVPVYWLSLLLLVFAGGGYFWMNEKGERAEVRGERAEVRGETAEVRGERAEVRGETAEVRGETAEVRGETAEVRGERAEISNVSILLSPEFDEVKAPLSFNINVNDHVPGLQGVAAPPVIAKVKKWSYGVTASAGISGLSDGNLFNINKSLASDMPTPFNAAFAPSYTPYRIVAGPSFSAGLTIKRELSKKFHVSTGLSYLQLSTKFKTGNQVYGTQVANAAPPINQFVRNYFTLDQHKPNDYTNVYRFIEAPVTLHTRLTNVKSFPVYWNIGLSYSRLISSNSKQFDGSTGVYYDNKKAVNRNQGAITTGFDFVLLGRTKYPLWVGPAARYHVSRLTNETFAEKKNVFSAGVNVKLFLR